MSSTILPFEGADTSPALDNPVPELREASAPAASNTPFGAEYDLDASWTVVEHDQTASTVGDPPSLMSSFDANMIDPSLRDDNITGAPTTEANSQTINLTSDSVAADVDLTRQATDLSTPAYPSLVSLESEIITNDADKILEFRCFNYIHFFTLHNLRLRDLDITLDAAFDNILSLPEQVRIPLLNNLIERINSIFEVPWRGFEVLFDLTGDAFFSRFPRLGELVLAEQSLVADPHAYFNSKNIDEYYITFQAHLRGQVYDPPTQTRTEQEIFPGLVVYVPSDIIMAGFTQRITRSMAARGDQQMNPPPAPTVVAPVPVVVAAPPAPPAPPAPTVAAPPPVAVAAPPAAIAPAAPRRRVPNTEWDAIPSRARAEADLAIVLADARNWGRNILSNRRTDSTSFDQERGNLQLRSRGCEYCADLFWHRDGFDFRVWTQASGHQKAWAVLWHNVFEGERTSLWSSWPPDFNNLPPGGWHAPAFTTPRNPSLQRLINLATNANYDERNLGLARENHVCRFLLRTIEICRCENDYFCHSDPEINLLAAYTLFQHRHYCLVVEANRREKESRKK